MKKVLLLLAILSLNTFAQKLISNKQITAEKFNISGRLIYANKYESPITETKIFLLLEGKVIDSSITDSQGKYLFSVNDNGLYKLIPGITKSWGPLAMNNNLAILEWYKGNLAITNPIAKKRLM